VPNSIPSFASSATSRFGTEAYRENGLATVVALSVKLTFSIGSVRRIRSSEQRRDGGVTKRCWTLRWHWISVSSFTTRVSWMLGF
jgi:hypothetical protein